MEIADNHQFNCDKLLRFLSRGASGYVFAMADDFRFIPQINNSLMQGLESKEIGATTIFVDGKSDMPLLYQIKQAAFGKQALIVANLYEIVNDTVTGRSNLLHLNFSREELQELSSAILFWADKTSIGVISNVAVDLFSQRSFTTVHFTGTVERPVEEVLQREGWQEFISTERLREIEARVETLRHRLQDAEKANYPVKRVIEEIALPLAKEYLDLGENDKAVAILERYKESINAENYTQLEQLAHIYYDLHQYQQAIDYLQQANSLLKNSELVLEQWYINVVDIADWMLKFGLLVEAKEMLIESKNKLTNKTIDYLRSDFIQEALAIITERLGNITQALGDLQSSKDYYSQGLDIRKGLAKAKPYNEQLKRDLSISYENLGNIARLLGDLQAAKDHYNQGLNIAEELVKADPHDEQLKRDLSISYTKLSSIAEEEYEYAKADNYMQEALLILQRLSADNPDSQVLKNDMIYVELKIAELQKLLETKTGKNKISGLSTKA